MNVLVRSKRVEGIRRRREGFRGVGAEKLAAPATPPEANAPSASAAATKIRPPVAVSSSGGNVRREHGTCSGKPLTNDQAVYHCECGFVFEAPVSTSVGCPHCGGTQAW